LGKKTKVGVWVVASECDIRMHEWKTKPKTHLWWRGGEKKQKVSDACCALYITVLVAGALELETNVLHVLDPMVRCICTAIMVAIPLFPLLIYVFRYFLSIYVHSFCI
jgi:hypothetical protein